MNIIGIDHGFSQMKTTNHLFTSSLNESKINLHTFNDILTVDGKTYQVGGQRKKHNKNKTINDDYYYLTLASIAKEIQTKKLNSDIDVHLAVGLPLMDYQRNYLDFMQYLKRTSQPVYFSFNDTGYCIHIQKVSCYVQGFSAIYNEWNEQRLNDDEPFCAVIDVGGWTTDTFNMIEGIPQTDTMISQEFGTIELFNNIHHRVQSETGSSIADAQIQYYLMDKPLRLAEMMKKLIDEECELYAQSLISKLSETKIDVQSTPLIFLGGGSVLLKTHLSRMIHPDMIYFIDDIHANAKGYEVLAYDEN